MNIVQKIKQQQIADAEDRGEEHPYLNPTGISTVSSNKPLNKLQQIKAAQLEEAEKSGINPYHTSAGAESAAPGKPVGTDVGRLDHYQSAMAIDLERIKAETTLEGKARVKQTALPTYIGFVDDYIENGDDYPNDIAVQVMIWLLDIGDIEHGLYIALALIKQGQKMPVRFDRTMPAFLCDFIYDWAKKQLDEDHSASPYLDVLVATFENEKWDLNPLFFTKLCSMLAKHKERNGEYQTALDLCIKAETINPEKAGVKGLKERLEKALQNQKAEEQTQASGTS